MSIHFVFKVLEMFAAHSVEDLVCFFVLILFLLLISIHSSLSGILFLFSPFNNAQEQLLQPFGDGGLELDAICSRSLQQLLILSNTFSINRHCLFCCFFPLCLNPAALASFWECRRSAERREMV